jgi:hypothetical protein
MQSTTGPPQALARFHELVDNWKPTRKYPIELDKLYKVLARAGFDSVAVDSLVEHLVSAGAVKSPSGQRLYTSEAARTQYLKKQEAFRAREEAREKRKAIRKAIKETPKIERRYLYAGVLAKAIADDSALSVYAKMAAVVIDDRLNNFPKHHRRNRTIGLGELADRMGSTVGKATAARAVQELVDARYLYVDEPGGGRRGTLYGFPSEIETYGREE